MYINYGFLPHPADYKENPASPSFRLTHQKGEVVGCPDIVYFITKILIPY